MSILCTHLAILDGKVLSESEAKNAAEFYLKVLCALEAFAHAKYALE
jgi:hypothetical protein